MSKDWLAERVPGLLSNQVASFHSCVPPESTWYVPDPLAAAQDRWKTLRKSVRAPPASFRRSVKASTPACARGPCSPYAAQPFKEPLGSHRTVVLNSSTL